MSTKDQIGGLAAALEELVQDATVIDVGTDVVELAQKLDHLLMIRDVGLCGITPSQTIVLEGYRPVVDSIVDELLSAGWVDVDGEVVTKTPDGQMPSHRRAHLAFYGEA